MISKTVDSLDKQVSQSDLGTRERGVLYTETKTLYTVHFYYYVIKMNSISGASKGRDFPCSSYTPVHTRHVNGHTAAKVRPYPSVSQPCISLCDCQLNKPFVHLILSPSLFHNKSKERFITVVAAEREKNGRKK